MNKTSLHAAYGHGYRIGSLAKYYGASKRTVLKHNAPEWMGMRLRRFVWRQGLRDAAGVISLFSILKAMGL